MHSENGIIFAIKKYSIHDGPGIRTTVFFKGCPLKCWWCHNPEGIAPQQEIIYWEDKCIGCGDCLKACPNEAIYHDKGLFLTNKYKCNLNGKCAEVCPTEAREIIGKRITVSQVMKEIEKDVIFYDESGGGVTFSGGEPLMQSSFLNSLLESCKTRNINTVVDTSGYVETITLLRISKSVDLFLYDLKLMDDYRHRKYTAVSNQLILQNLKELSEQGNRIIIRFTVIPGINDDDENINELGNFVASLKNINQIDALPYHNVYVEKLKRLKKSGNFLNIQNSANNRIHEIVERLREFKLKVIVGG